MTSKEPAHQKSSRQQPLLHRQKGNILVMFTVSLVALISMVSLALDGGHLLLNKAKLQNLLDTAALHAAKELDEGATHSEARLAAMNIIQLNLAHSDHSELASAIDLTTFASNSNQVTSQLKIEFSQRPDPFVIDNNITSKYVKLTVSQLDLTNFLADVMGFNKQVSASALAGPSTNLTCFNSLVPMLVCGDKDAEPTETTMFGLPKGGLHMLKAPAQGETMGPGNYQLIQLGYGAGANVLRATLAGEHNTGEVCFSPGTSIPTKTGNNVGPVADGLNTRMGSWGGSVNSTDHPRDTNVCQGSKIVLNAAGNDVEAGARDKSYSYAMYKSDTSSCSNPVTGNATGNIVGQTPAQHDRRVMNIAIGDCSGTNNGSSNVSYLGSGCYFLTQSVGHTGQDSYVVGEMLEKCSAEGIPSGVAQDGSGPHTIVLYHVPGSTDS
jgi:Flp pilus assembly protein TadG